MIVAKSEEKHQTRADEQKDAADRRKRERIDSIRAGLLEWLPVEPEPVGYLYDDPIFACGDVWVVRRTVPLGSVGMTESRICLVGQCEVCETLLLSEQGVDQLPIGAVLESMRTAHQGRNKHSRTVAAIERDPSAGDLDARWRIRYG